MSVKLKADHRLILAYLLRNEREGAMRCVWVAEACGHAYDTPWASSRLASMAKRGLTERTAPGCYRLTEAGRLALKDSSHER